MASGRACLLLWATVRHRVTVGWGIGALQLGGMTARFIDPAAIRDPRRMEYVEPKVPTMASASDKR